MSDPIPIERLQPCLLDRLTDDEPDKQQESRSQRVISHQRYRQGFLRDTQWLFNTQAYLRLEGLESFQLHDYPEAYRSVINYGVRQLCGLTAPNMEQLQNELAEAIRTFEPRLSAAGLDIRADQERNQVTLEIEGELWANPLPEHLHIKTTLDIETGQCLLGDAPYG